MTETVFVDAAGGTVAGSGRFRAEPFGFPLAEARVNGQPVAPDPAPFEPDAYFNWLLGSPQ